VKSVLHVLHSRDDNVHRHLATEDLLLQWAQEERMLLYLWSSRRAAVIGKNQNPWSEVWITRLDQENCQLARRVSGGGAVYHDLGNLNVSFVLPRSVYRRELVYCIFEEALRALGAEPKRIGRAGIGVDGRKISGHAFAFRGKAVLHHATILIEADLDALHRVLRDAPSRIESRAVRSEYARVANLTEFTGEISQDGVAETITAAAADILNADGIMLPEPPLETQSELASRTATFASWDWLYGYTPPFCVRLQQQVGSRDMYAQLTVKSGRIASGFVRLEAMNPPRVELTDCRFDLADLRNRMNVGGWDIGTSNAVATALLNA
jgi:lipoate-protein ligase A